MTLRPVWPAPMTPTRVPPNSKSNPDDWGHCSPACIRRLMLCTFRRHISISRMVISATAGAMAAAAWTTLIPRFQTGSGRRCLMVPAEWATNFRFGQASTTFWEKGGVPQPVTATSQSRTRAIISSSERRSSSSW